MVRGGSLISTHPDRPSDDLVSPGARGDVIEAGRTFENEAVVELGEIDWAATVGE